MASGVFQAVTVTSLVEAFFTNLRTQTLRGYQDGMWKFLTLMVQLSLVHSLTHCVLLALKAYAGFWQYGTLQWDEVYRYLTTLVVSAVPWRIFQYESTQQQRGAPCPSSAQVVQTGHYILLSSGKN
jgi:hypothetical protein